MAIKERTGVKLAYQDEGSGDPAFVFIHGWTCNRSYFNPQHDRFKANHRVVSVDLRGHGEGDKPKEAYPISQNADDVAWLIGQLGLDRPIAHLTGAYRLAVPARDSLQTCQRGT
ncbi:MAG TPA: alpha/beta hydrolase [Chloroflexota bacterium]|jgi:pimeloyl-ACP methyl ester carboxylesterase